MKIVLANPPVVYSNSATPKNDFRFREFVISRKLWRLKGFPRFYHFMNHCFGPGKGVRYGVRAGSRWPFTLGAPTEYAPYPFIMGYTAAVLAERGFDVELMDAVACGEVNYRRFLERIRRARPDIVLLECSTPTIVIDLWFAQKVADFAEVALAGPHLVHDAEKTAFENRHIKYFLKGEYILSALRMMEKRTGGIYDSEIVKDLDDIPFAYRNFEESLLYYDPSMPTPRPQLQIYASKGCPFKCTYCLWPHTMYRGNVALRSPDKVAEEIRLCVEKQNYRSIFFDDDTFNLGDDRISALCDHLKRIGLPWTMMGRLDCSPLWLFDKMIDCGCVGMRFGIETFDAEVSRKIKKGLKAEDVKSVLRYLCNTYPRLMLHVTMMKNLPGQTRAIHERDMEILSDMGFSLTNPYRSYQLSSCVPFPGTALYADIVKRYGMEGLSDHKMYDGSQEGFNQMMERLYD
ncbi:MAG: B12-binding domain-containing radical SAM protein [Synergistaceae bacterium]|jgi:radical SAM superfamily enzyme YgiQ (UPF0313 family)|nr:B12-binding domain-containing radical SAM protein [Synergistaceae bacterium]